MDLRVLLIQEYHEVESIQGLAEVYGVARDFRDKAVAALKELSAIEARASLEDVADHVLERRS